ncbi:hypothetical protein CM318V1_200043 [Carnobacterium maltaromaticum]|nr:hypothetical protein CM318V1_200043 [Carnobacterium maltaromaticum]
MHFNKCSCLINALLYLHELTDFLVTFLLSYKENKYALLIDSVYPLFVFYIFLVEKKRKQKSYESKIDLGFIAF